jgi:hypothetical protein
MLTVLEDGLNEIDSDAGEDYSGSLPDTEELYLEICGDTSECVGEIPALAKDINKLIARFPAFASNFNEVGLAVTRHFARYVKLACEIETFGARLESHCGASVWRQYRHGASGDRAHRTAGNGGELIAAPRTVEARP